MWLFCSISLSLFLLVEVVLSATPWSVSPFNPSAVPLAVRSPYLSAWLNQASAGTALNGDWAKFWTGTIVGWAGYVRVDGHPVTQITATQSIFTLTAGGVDITVTFLSPIEPTDLVKQSLPFSYVSVVAAPNDGNSHTVQVYTDISAEWITGNNSLIANWTTDTSNNAIIHQTQLAQQQPYTEISDHIQFDIFVDGSAFHATLSASGTTTSWQTGEDVALRTQFVNNGVLQYTQDTSFRGVSDKWPVFSLAHDLGLVNSASDPVVFAVGHVRDPAVEYLGANGQTQHRSLYFWTKYNSVSDALVDFLKDYPNALQRAKAFDDRLTTDASKISLDYIDVASQVARQAFAATEITVSRNADNSLNTSDVYMFVKEISSSGNVNTVDNIFAALPLYLYANPALGKAALAPLLEYQASGQYPNLWAVHDLGRPYPQALGHNDGQDTQMPIEESGNMLIMTLSYTLRTNDTSLVTRYFSLLDQWAKYLVTNTIAPANQLSTDTFQGTLANQTNLAAKGILGIRAMAEIARIAGDTARASSYNAIGFWHIISMETNCLGQISSQILYSQQNQIGISQSQILLGFHLIAGWEIWGAAMVTANSVRDQLITSVHKYMAGGLSSKPYGDWYDTTNGSAQSFAARPVVGSHFAFLALPNAILSNSTSTTGDGGGSGSIGSSQTSQPMSTAPTSKNEASTIARVSQQLVISLLFTVYVPE
ncbi:hypothetical protein NLI96_g2242 [Meripilus lineatus]|uniref:DUF1793-domain-containing protein n=1 Tax=Meripilus lineatus TaxID=2056292 RepID=A0AAD5V942_9APHY|nr:hypothetical protein NLI96_g2242 [Physisporinus lineatus]